MSLYLQEFFIYYICEFPQKHAQRVFTIAVANPLRAINRLVYSVPLVQSQTNQLFLMDNL